MKLTSVFSATGAVAIQVDEQRCAYFEFDLVDLATVPQNARKRVRVARVIFDPNNGMVRPAP